MFNIVTDEAPATGTGSPENEIMQRVACGDAEALAALYDLYAARVFGVCLRILNETQLAEDTLQEVFLRIWERARLFEQSRGTVHAWLMGITRNTCIDQLRRIQTRPQVAEPPEGSDALPFEETLAAPESDVPGLAAASERAALVRLASASLSPEQQLVIHLSYFKGLTRREIARRLNWPVGTVHTRARLALQNLRSRLEELGIEADDLQ
jgi:RNA polymerase sigma-70 factor (ECF subfamily)